MTFSSTVREVRGTLRGLQALHAAHPALTKGHIQLWGDNLGAISACTPLRGNRLVFAEVKALFTWVWSHQLTLSFVWKPRTQQGLQLADFLSEWEGPADWRLSREHLRKHVFPHTGHPNINFFTSVKAHQRTTHGFFSSLWYPNPQCLAVDVWPQHWGQ